MMLQSRSLVLPLLFAAIRMANFAVIGVESFTVTRPPSLHMRRHKANGSIHGKSSILIATSSSATYRGPNWEAATRRTSSLHGIDQTKLVDEEIMTAQGKDLFVWSKQWYPVIPLSYLLDKPFPFRLLGRNLVAWKSEDGSIFTVMEDECPHRKAPLSTGKIVDGCNIMCRYHGWQFDTDGKCTNIPMFPIFDGDDGSKLKSFINKDVFHARSFPTKAAGGLLWTYLGVGETEAGPIPNEALMPEELLENLGWFAYSFPVSYMSMVENSFDPSHAPFIHEGVTFSPEGATPMLKYKLLDNTTMSTSGFTMEHSPYQKNDTSHTIRKFTSPSSQKTISPFFPSGIYLYFVPSGPRETLTITALPLPKIKFSRFIPHSLREMMYDGAHFSFFTSKSNHRFVMVSADWILYGRCLSFLLFLMIERLRPGKSCF